MPTTRGTSLCQNRPPLEQFLDIPYLEDGESFAGADCVGLPRLYLRECCGIDVSAINTQLARRCWTDGGAEMLYAYLGQFFDVAPEAGMDGDLLVFIVPRSKVPHFGVLTPDGQFLHTDETHGRSARSHLVGPWKRTLTRVFRARRAE